VALRGAGGYELRGPHHTLCVCVCVYGEREREYELTGYHVKLLINPLLLEEGSAHFTARFTTQHVPFRQRLKQAETFLNFSHGHLQCKKNTRKPARLTILVILHTSAYATVWSWSS